MTSCLVFGDGPSKTMLSLEDRFDVDLVIGSHYVYHPQTDVVCSVDIWLAQKKECVAAAQGVPVVIGVPDPKRPLHPKFKDVADKVTQIQRPNGNDTTGMFCVYYAVLQGYKEIYTAGIDYIYSGGKVYRDPKMMIRYCNAVQSLGVNLYKVNPKSKMPVPVKLPPVKQPL